MSDKAIIMMGAGIGSTLGGVANRVDYSGAALPTLHEAALRETDGVGDGTDKITFGPGGSKPS